MRRLVLLFSFFMVFRAEASVWKSKHSWNPEWEHQYSQWIEATFNEEVFLKPPYGPIATDCADAAYLPRLIFSFENSLPFQLVSGANSESGRFDSIVNDAQRFKAFRDWVLASTNTQSLFEDTFPIEIDAIQTYFHPGVLLIQKRQSSGHAETLVQITEGGRLIFLGSTVPIKTRKLLKISALTIVPKMGSSGFRSWRQFGLKIEENFGYGLNQYNLNGNFQSHESLDVYLEQLTQILARRTETAAEATQYLGDDLCRILENRVDVVNDAYEVRQRKGPGVCMNAEEFELYSTPARDQRIKRILARLLSVNNPAERFQASDIKDEVIPDSCKSIVVFPGRIVNTVEFLQKLVQGLVSSDPNSKMGERWGVNRISQRNCPVY